MPIMTSPMKDKAHNRLMQLFSPDPVKIRAELVHGLSQSHAFVSPKYLYDPLGSRLFTAICELQEYYPTRTESAIYERHIDEIAEAAGTGVILVDLGAGDCKKAERLIPHLGPRQYVPVDISAEFLRDALRNLQCRFPGLEIVGLGMDFSATLQLPNDVGVGRRLFFYPGSSIGNFTTEEALAFLRQVSAACRAGYGKSEGGGLLIGVDLVKEEELLNAAYDDALGVTAAFNLNILSHMNRLLDADFNVRDWRHKAYFNHDRSRVEMHLEARANLTVRWDGGERRFERGETIHTESSYKYTRSGFLSLLEQAGFSGIRTWTDERNWFMVCHAQAM